MEERRERRIALVWSLVVLASMFVIIIAGYAAAFGFRWAAFILIGALAARHAANLTLGFIRYRETMARPWPRVEPVDDDE